MPPPSRKEVQIHSFHKVDLYVDGLGYVMKGCRKQDRKAEQHVLKEAADSYNPKHTKYVLHIFM